MSDNWVTTDLRAMAESLRSSIKQFGGFNPEQVRKAGSMGEEALRHYVLLALEDGAKTGHEILELISHTTKSARKPTAANLYPLLENMTDVGLVTAEFKKDRKTYSITKAGQQAASEPKSVSEPELETEGTNWFSPNWVDLRGELAKAGRRLARVSMDVAQQGTKDQQDRAAAILDEARRAMHEILAEK